MLGTALNMALAVRHTRDGGASVKEIRGGVSCAAVRKAGEVGATFRRKKRVCHDFVQSLGSCAAYGGWTDAVSVLVLGGSDAGEAGSGSASPSSFFVPVVSVCSVPNSPI